MDYKKFRIAFSMVLLLTFSDSAYSKTITDAIDLMKKEDYESSIETLNEIIADNAEYPIAYKYRGYAFMMTENYPKAIADYKKSDELSSTLDSQMGIQWSLLANGQFEESLVIGNKILERDPSNYYAKYRVADAYLGMKYYKKASEKYRVLELENGKSADLLWKLGLCEYYNGNKKEATLLFQEGGKLSPEHKGLQYSLAHSEVYPQISVLPEFSSFNFRNSDFVGGGQKSGLGISYSPNEAWSIRANIINDKTKNLNSTVGVVNYIADPLNLAYLVQYKYINFPSSIPSYYLNQPTNLYNLSQLATAQDYVTNKYSLGLSYKISEKFSVHFSPQMLQSNASTLNGSSAVQAGLSYTKKYTLNFSAASIYTPNNSGGQISASLYYPFLENFYSSSTLTGQTMKVKTTETVYLSYSPLLTTSETVRTQKGYGFFQQEFGYIYNSFIFSVGGRYGSARTPLMGENWIYTGFDLLHGGYVQIGIKTNDLTVQLQYSQDRWLDTRNEKPISDSIKLMLIWRL